MDEQKAHILSLRNYMKKRLLETIPDIAFNGPQKGEFLYTLLNVAFPPGPKTELLSFSMDIAGISASGGSACTSGTEQGSYVLADLGLHPKHKSIRFSFSHLTTKEEVDYAVDELAKILLPETARV